MQKAGKGEQVSKGSSKQKTKEKWTTNFICILCKYLHNIITEIAVRFLLGF